MVCFTSSASEIYQSDMIDSIVSTFPKIDAHNCKIKCLETGTTVIEYGMSNNTNCKRRVWIRNRNGVKFLIMLDNATVAINKIKDWLDQFYTKRIDNDKVKIDVPVIYGKSRNLVIQPSSTTLLFTKNNRSEIQIIYRYKTIIPAQINKDDEIGYIVYKTSIYKHPIIKPLVAGYNIKRANWLHCIRDSFCYLIFGSSWFKVTS